MNPKVQKIRTKKLAILVKDARLSAGKSEAEAAQALSISEGRYRTYELGTQSPSLPELEISAFLFNVPLNHFWGSQLLSEKPRMDDSERLNKLHGLRQRIVGASVRKARMEAALTTGNLSEMLAISEEQLESYELGKTPIPLPELEMIASAVDKPIHSFFDHTSFLGQWADQQQSVKQFLDLDPDLKTFVCKPINQPYLHLAVRLSEMSVDKLRAVAEGLLEITY